MPHKREDESLREELAQLRSDMQSLVGTVGRLADGAASSFTHEAKRVWSDAGDRASHVWSDVGDRASEVYDSALAQGRHTLRTTEKTIQSHPFLSLAIAAGLGLLLGRLTSR